MLACRSPFGSADWLQNLSGRLEAGPWREWNVVAMTRTAEPLRTGTSVLLAACLLAHADSTVPPATLRTEFLLPSFQFLH